MTAGTTHQALYRRWRAQTFSEIVGQEAVVATLRNAVLTGQVAHAILFTGPRGTGKTSLARILAKALNCERLAANADPCDACPSCVAIREGRALDLVEIDAASNRGINDVRELRERLNYAPTDLRRKVYILDEAHQITKDAWNALLKSLEEPPDFVTFMFASTHPQDFPPAILSRLQRFDVRRLSPAEITGKLTRILEADGRDADPEAVAVVARLAAGGMRDAESILDQLLASTAGRIEADAVRELLGLADSELVGGFTAALADGDASAGIATLDRLEDRGRDLRVFLDQVVDALRERILADLATGAADAAIAAAARRLAAIDPTRLGPGGLRLQLELALLEPALAARSATITAPGSPPAARPAAPARAQALPPAGPPARPAATPVESPAAAAATSVPSRPRPASPWEFGVRDPEDVPAPAPQPTPDPASAAAPAAAPATSAPEPSASAPPSTPAAASAPPQAPVATAAPEAPVAPVAQPAPDPAPVGTPVAIAMGETPPGSDIDRLRHGWSQVVTLIAQRSPAAKAAIVDCRPMGVDGRVVTIGFPEEKAFLRDATERRRPLLEECITAFLGHEVGVRVIATNLDLIPPLPDDQDAGYILGEGMRIFAESRIDAPEIS